MNLRKNLDTTKMSLSYKIIYDFVCQAFLGIIRY